MTESQVRKLVKKARTGDKRAFEKLIRAKNKNITYIALSILKNQHDAEDAAQDAIESMYNHIKGLQAPEAFETWMYRIVFRACLKIKQSGKRQKATDIEELSDMNIVERRSEFLPHEHNEKAEMRRLLLCKMKELPDSYRNCLYLFYYEEMSYEQIAQVLGSSVKDVSNWLDRGRKKLRSEIDYAEMKERTSASLEPALFAAAFALDIGEITSNESMVEDSLKKVLLAGSASSAGALFLNTLGTVAVVAGLALLIGISGLFFNEPTPPSNSTGSTIQSEATEGESEDSPEAAAEEQTEGIRASSEDSNEGSTEVDPVVPEQSVYWEDGGYTVEETSEGIVIENIVLYGLVDPDDPGNFDTETNPGYYSNEVSVAVETDQGGLGFLLGKTGDEVWLAVIFCSTVALVASLAMLFFRRKRG